MQEVKLPIRQNMVQALALRAIALGTNQAIADMACDALCNFSALRIGHFAPESSKDMRHVLVWSDLYFYPSRQSCSAIFVHINSTKSRHIKECRPTWTAVGRVTSVPIVCPVAWMLRHFESNFSRRPDDPVFARPGSATPFLRQPYAARLRNILLEAVSEYIPSFHVDVKTISGISWRKAGITALSRQAAAARLNMNQVRFC
eukprot:SAG11_NODE_1809_length_4224_cov_5.960000_2_plen_202_part_00